MHRPVINRRGVALAKSAALVILAAATAAAQTTSTPGAPRPQVDPKINEPFQKPDVKAYIKRFESDERETYAKRHEIVAALRLTPGMSVADLGAGTGLFTRLIAEKVGATGKVYAVDISPQFLGHIAAESKKRKQSQVVTVLANQDTTRLAASSVDLVFLCDVYHHLERPEKTLASIREALKPGGKLVVVDFDRVDGQSSAFVLQHVRAGKELFRKEIEAAGFLRVAPSEPSTLKENFLMLFRRPASPKISAE